MKVKLNRDHVLYNTQYSEGDVVEVTKDTGRRLIKISVASPIKEPEDNMAIDVDRIENRKVFYE